MEEFIKKLRELFKSKPAENNNQRNNSNFDQKRNFTRNLILLIVLLVFVIPTIISNLFAPEPELVSYNDFLIYLNSNKIDTVFYSTGSEYMTFALIPDGEERRTDPAMWDIRLYDPQNLRKTLYPGSTDFREKILLTGTNIKISNSGIAGSILLSLAPVILLCVFYFLIFKKMGTPFAEAKEDDLIQTSNVNFSDIIGHDEILEDVKFATALLKDPTLGKDIGTKIPKGLLFTGPPGTGKTLIAKAIAHEAGVPFLYQNASGLIEMYVGLGARRIRHLFKVAKAHAPCVVFIDEIDAVGNSRNANRGTSENEQTINALLQEMDGFNGRDGVFVIAATNRPETLDEALVRSGRFDRQIAVNPPRDWQTRNKLFKHHLKSLTVDENIDTETISKQIPGFTGADIAMICNEASLIAAMSNKSCIDTQCLEEAVDKKIFNGSRSKNTGYEVDRQIIAYHEAGHAVMSLLLKEPVARASIQSTTSGVGGAVFNEDKDSLFMTNKEMENRILIAYAGRASEEIKFKDVTTGASNDISQATSVMLKYIENLGFDKEFGLLDINVLSQQHLVNSDIISEKMSAMSRELYEKCFNMLKDNYDAVEKVATELLDKETVSGEELKRILNIDAACQLPIT